MLVAAHEPLDKEGQLRVIHQIHHADLLPAQFGTVWAVTVAVHRRPAQALLHRRDVGDGNHPAQPTAAADSSALHRLSERRAVHCRMVERADHLYIAATLEGKDEVPRPEAWVQSSIAEGGPKLRPEPLDGLGEIVRSYGIGDVVQAHAWILP